MFRQHCRELRGQTYYLLTYGKDVEHCDNEREQQSAGQSGQQASVGNVGEERYEDVHIICADDKEQGQRHDEDSKVEPDGEQLVRTGNSGRAIADEQQVLKLSRVLLHKKEDAQHEDIETEYGNHYAHSHHHSHHHAQEIGCLLSVELVGINVIPLAPDVFRYVLVSGISHLHYDTRRLRMLPWGILFVGPFHKRLWNKNGVKPAGVTNNTSAQTVFVTIALEEECEVNHSHQPLRQLGQRAALGEAEIIHRHIRAWQYDGYGVVTRLVFPAV